MSVSSFCYDALGWMGERLARVFSGLNKDLELAGVKLHPAVYMSIVSFAFFISLVPAFIGALTFVLPLILKYVKLSALPGLLMELLIALPLPMKALMIAMPLLVLVLGALVPKLIAQSRVYGFELELPYVSAYLAVMVAGGLSFFEGLRRLRKIKLLSNTARYVNRVEALILTEGITPLTALERFANTLGVKSFKELVLGYISTLRSGGDVLNYVTRKAELFFNEMLSRMKATADRLSLLMESCVTVVVLGGIGLYLVFIVSISMSDVLGATLSPGTFFLFSFVTIPGICLLFIYLADMTQISYPEPYGYRYVPLVISLPFIALFVLECVVSQIFPIPVFPFFEPIVEATRKLAYSVGLNEGYVPAIALCLILILGTLPSLIHEYFYERLEKSYIIGISNFLRDLVEVRKSGLTPEKCIINLSQRDYGSFSKIVKRISRGVLWGIPLHRIYEDIAKEIKNWLVSINLILLVDTMEVGGGTVETLENMAKFSELMILIEKEKRSLLKPLVLVPYMGALMLTLVSITFLSFLDNMLGIAGTSLPLISLTKVIATPIVLQAYILGLTAGKIITGRISGGFKHAVFLVLVVLAALILSPYIDVGSMFGG